MDMDKSSNIIMGGSSKDAGLLNFSAGDYYPIIVKLASDGVIGW
jgi:hypothetical protein